ncbi:MAG: PIN domain-containing protein [Bacteroidales bacterium]|nr:PIN domain-containing protein [Bacteroidales bacterium]
MKGYILDTDIWIELFHHRGEVAKHIAETPANQIFASEVTIAELTYGALHSNAVERHLQEPKEIDSCYTQH